MMKNNRKTKKKIWKLVSENNLASLLFQKEYSVKAFDFFFYIYNSIVFLFLFYENA